MGLLNLYFGMWIIYQIDPMVGLQGGKFEKELLWLVVEHPSEGLFLGMQKVARFTDIL